MKQAQLANPFPGSRPFDVDTAHLYFGRDRDIGAVLGKLAQHRLVTLLGAEHSGKSSLLRAGLVARLEGGFLADTQLAWRVAMLEPDASPLRSLARALADSGDPADDLAHARVEAVLRRSSAGLAEAVRLTGLPAATSVLIVVDQFEKVFDPPRGRSRDERDEIEAFVALLASAAAQRDVPIYVALALRSNCLEQCAQLGELAERLFAGVHVLARADRDACREAIVGPIAASGARVEPALVQQVLNDLDDVPDVLSKIQDAMSQAWSTWARDRRSDQPVGIAHYPHEARVEVDVSEAAAAEGHSLLARLSRAGDLEIALPPGRLPKMSAGLGELVRRGRRRFFNKGSVLIRENEPGDELFVLLSGKLGISVRNRSERAVDLGVCLPGDYVGDMSLDGGVRSATVVALETSECAVITREALGLHFRDHPDFAFELLARVIGRARMATRSIQDKKLISSYGRLSDELHRMAIPQPDGTRVIPRGVTPREVALRIGCAPQMVEQLMGHLADNGLVVDEKRGLRLCMPDPGTDS